MQVIGKATTLFDRVESQGLNEADSQSDAAGDITCYKDGKVVLVVEVKDRAITLTDCSDTVTKARGSGITNVFVCRAVHQGRSGYHDERTQRQGMEGRMQRVQCRHRFNHAACFHAARRKVEDRPS